MKKNLILLLIFVLAIALLAACGSEKHEPTVVIETPAPVTETAKPEQTPEAPAVTPEPVETAQVEEDPDEDPDDEKYQTALRYINANVEDLYKAIGYPENKDYGPSCLGDYDQDGQLDYDGFSVFTVVKGDVETVYDVFRDGEF